MSIHSVKPGELDKGAFATQPAEPSGACAACGATRVAVVETGRDNRYGIPGDYSVVRCQECGLMRTSPRPSEAELLALYESHYTPEAADTPTSGLPVGLKRGVLYWIWNWWSGCGAFRNLPARGRVLDVGCLRGDMMLELRKRGREVVGLELNPKAAAIAAARGLQVRVATLLTTDLSDESFDTLILSQVLEHTADPLANLCAARRLLRAGGRLILTCPNAGSALRTVFGRHWAGYHLPFHLHHFDPRSLARLLRRAGFRVRRISTHTPDYWWLLSLRAALNSMEGRYRLGRGSSHLLTRALVAPLFRIADLLRLGDGLLVIAEKTSETPSCARLVSRQGNL